LVWLPAQFSASALFPLFGSVEQAIWLSQVEPKIQGRVFAVQLLSQQSAIALAVLIAGPLSDNLFEPVMMPDRKLSLILGRFFGVGAGAGTAVLFELCACCMVLIGISSYLVPALQDLDES
jgi:MFS transporter, DHA3 family, macrolide efflux protein